VWRRVCRETDQQCRLLLGFRPDLALLVSYWRTLQFFFLALVAFLASLFSTFDMNIAFAIIDYMRPMDHAFKIEMMPRLITFDDLSVVFSIGAALLNFIKQNRNILLNILPQYLAISERLRG
jgi:hypothetical protein